MRNPIKNALKSLFKNPRHIIFAIYRRIPWIIRDDERYLKIYCRLSGFKNMDFDNPKTYNEKLQWLKLYNRRPEYTMMVDKYAVKSYVASIIGEKYVIPTLAKWESPSEIDFSTLPEQFVVKTNHDSGNNGVVICKDKHLFDVKKAYRELWHSWHRNSYLIAREWPYKDVEKCVFAEQYMEDKQYGELRDYKFFCFDGEVKMLFIATGRSIMEHAYFNYFDTDFKPLNIKNGHPISNEPIAKPQSFELMKELASKLSKGIPHVRVDFYEVDGHPYFGEFTFFHMGGTGIFDPEEWNQKIGDWITLPNRLVDKNLL